MLWDMVHFSSKAIFKIIILINRNQEKVVQDGDNKLFQIDLTVLVDVNLLDHFLGVTVRHPRPHGIGELFQLVRRYLTVSVRVVCVEEFFDAPFRLQALFLGHFFGSLLYAFQTITDIHSCFRVSELV